VIILVVILRELGILYLKGTRRKGETPSMEKVRLSRGVNNKDHSGLALLRMPLFVPHTGKLDEPSPSVAHKTAI
jgi:hypothetical protein